MHLHVYVAMVPQLVNTGIVEALLQFCQQQMPVSCSKGSDSEKELEDVIEALANITATALGVPAIVFANAGDRSANSGDVSSRRFMQLRKTIIEANPVHILLKVLNASTNTKVRGLTSRLQCY